MEAQRTRQLARSTQWYLCAGTPPGGGPAGWPAAACSWTWYWPSWPKRLNGPPQSSGPLHPVAGPGTHRCVARSLAGPRVGGGVISRVGNHFVWPGVVPDSLPQFPHLPAKVLDIPVLQGSGGFCRSQGSVGWQKPAQQLTENAAMSLKQTL